MWELLVIQGIYRDYIARNKVSTYSGLGACEETPHAEKEYAKWAMLRSKLIPCFKLIVL